MQRASARMWCWQLPALGVQLRSTAGITSSVRNPSDHFILFKSSESDTCIRLSYTIAKMLITNKVDCKGIHHL